MVTIGGRARNEHYEFREHEGPGYWRGNNWQTW